MSRSRFLLSISFLVGCDDETCGTLGAPESGLLASSADVMLEYGEFNAGANNDCPSDPSVTSLTVTGKLAGGASGFITLCIPRPDQSNSAGRTLGLDQTPTDIRLVDVVGTANGCTYMLDRTRVPTGTGQTEGACGTDPAGFALVLDGAIGLTRKCGTDPMDTIGVMLTGRVAVHPAQ